MGRKRNKGVVSPLFNEAAKQAQVAAKLQKGMAGVAKAMAAYYQNLVDAGLPKQLCREFAMEFQGQLVREALRQKAAK